MKCRCNKRLRQEDERYGLCFNCRVRTVGFSFVGGGGYTQESFHNSTIAEKRAEILGDRVVGVDCEPV
jgi:hypothetical protein